jgi:hypothetical protein
VLRPGFSSIEPTPEFGGDASRAPAHRASPVIGWFLKAPNKNSYARPSHLTRMLDIDGYGLPGRRMGDHF